MNVWRSLAGVLEVELTSAELASALTAISEQGIGIYQLQKKDELTCRFRIPRGQYRQLACLAEKRGETLRIRKKMGLFWVGKNLRKRPVLLFGCIFFLILSLYLPGRVLFVRVEGNVLVPARQILAAAEENGVSFGASRRDIRSEKVKNGILSDVPQLQWVGVNTAGCVATVSVRERAVPEATEELPEVTRIVAARDGYILSGTVVQGNALFQVGQTVRRGQVLISGYTDCGFCIRATRSEGEIVAQTNREFTALTPSSCLVRREEGAVKRKISLIFRKKRINLWKDSGISDATCGRMYEEYYVTLPGGFRLPVALCVEEFTAFETALAERHRDEVQNALEEFARKYLHQQMVAGTIRSKNEAVTSENGVYVLHGSYVCEEMIGREQCEQIGDTNGKNS